MIMVENLLIFYTQTCLKQNFGTGTVRKHHPQLALWAWAKKPKPTTVPTSSQG